MKGDTDGAFVTLDDQDGPSEYKLKDGMSVKGSGTSNIKDKVMYYGAESEGVVTGVVTLVDFTTHKYKSGYTFTNQIYVDNSAPGKPGVGGDSGALIEGLITEKITYEISKSWDFAIDFRIFRKDFKISGKISRFQ